MTATFTPLWTNLLYKNKHIQNVVPKNRLLLGMHMIYETILIACVEYDGCEYFITVNIQA